MGAHGRTRTSPEDFAAESALVLGGACAILLQLADPVVAHAVAAHSAFRTRPVERLRATLGYAYGVVLGRPEQAARAAAHVERAHEGIPGANDLERQLWVAATLYWTAARVHRVVFGALDEHDADAVYRTYAVLGTALRVPPHAWPPDRRAFGRYWRRALATTEVTDDARAVARDLLHPAAVPWWGRAAMPLARALTAALLPPPVRAAYGLRAHPRRVAAALALLRPVYRALPRRVRQLPARRLLASRPTPFAEV